MSERPGPSPEEIARMNGERTLSDAQLIQGGAETAHHPEHQDNNHLLFTPEQKEQIWVDHVNEQRGLTQKEQAEQQREVDMEALHLELLVMWGYGVNKSIPIDVNQRAEDDAKRQERIEELCTKLGFDVPRNEEEGEQLLGHLQELRKGQ